MLGRTTTLPAADAPDPSAGNISLGYYDTDLVRSILQGATTTTFDLDALDRPSTEITTTGTASTQSVRHYADTSDNPTWVSQGSTTSRYAELSGGDLALIVDQSANADLTLTSPHGDIVTTVDLTPNQSATSIGGWSIYDGYGQTAATPSTGVVGYGWLGAKQRATTPAGLISMGARLYNGATGLFTTVDPVEVAESTPTPTRPTRFNSFDLSGQSWWRKALKVTAIVAGVGAVACGASVVCGIAVGAAAAAGAYAASHAGTRSWSSGGFGRATAFGALSGAAWGGGARAAGWRLQGGSRLTRGRGVRFSHRRGAHGTDFLRYGKRRLGIDGHRIPKQPRWKFIHYHRAYKGPGGGIGRHRPWDRYLDKMGW